MIVKDIISGHFKELFNSNEDLYNHRMVICEKCPLFKNTMVGPMCDNKKYYSIDYDDISDKPLEGYIRGCGCRLEAKTRVEKNRCPLNKW